MRDEGNTIRLAPGVRVHERDLTFTYVQSRGPGGQNVNKRATKAELRVSLESLGLDEGATGRLVRLAGRQVTDDGELVIASDRTRSQRRNRDDCIDRLSRLVSKAMAPPKVRRPTRPTKGSVRRRLETKRQRGELKRTRRPPGSD